MNNQNTDKVTLNKILRELYNLFPDPGMLALMKSLQDPMMAENPEQLQKILEQNLSYLNKKQQILKSHFNLKEKEVDNFMQDPTNFLPQEWEELQKIKNMFAQYQDKAVEMVETGHYKKKKPKKSAYSIDLKAKPSKRKKNWISCK